MNNTPGNGYHCGRIALHNPHDIIVRNDGEICLPGEADGEPATCDGTWTPNLERLYQHGQPPQHDTDPDTELDDISRDPISRPTMELTQWWIANASETIDKITSKINEYGGQNTAALDLLDVGHNLARIAGRTVTDEEATELGIYFYALGKLSRWTAAVAEGRRPSDDTLFDAHVYLTMAIRNRAAGGWPWPAK